MGIVGFIGLGRMGSGMANRLLDAGHDLKIYNRTQDRAREISQRGAKSALSPRAAADGAEIIFSMVSDDVASEAVWFGEDGILAADLSSNCICVECSTLSHGWVKELSEAVRARGLRYIDAPVTGLPDGAEGGTLTLLVGGEPSDIEAARAFFEPISNSLIHFGPVGAGTAYKLIINLIGAVQIASVAEGMALAERAGLDLDVFVEALSRGQAASPQVVRNAQFIADDSHEETVLFTPPLRLKDVDYALKLARGLGMGAPFGEVAEGQFRSLIDLGFEHMNESKVFDIARQARAGETE